MPQSIAETENKEVEAPKLRSIHGDAFVMLLPLQSSVDFSDTDFRGSQGEFEVNLVGRNLVTEPGSLTVTGPTRVDGAEVTVEAVGAGAPVCGVDELGYPGIEVGEPMQTVSGYSGMEKQRNVTVTLYYLSL